MTLIYKAVQSTLKTKAGKKLYHPRLVKIGNTVDTQAIGEMIAARASLTAGDVHNVIRNLMDVMRSQLQDSKSVHLDGLGTFTMIAKSNGKGVETAEKVSPNQITALRIQFTPEGKRNAGKVMSRAMTTGVSYQSLADLLKAANSSPTGSGTGDNGGTVTPGA